MSWFNALRWIICVLPAIVAALLIFVYHWAPLYAAAVGVVLFMSYLAVDMWLLLWSAIHPPKPAQTAPPTTPEVEMCPCGEPLHYEDAVTANCVRKIIADKGPRLLVRVGDNRYMVSRHYIALHGIIAEDLEGLADEGKIERV